jgi:diacylglycerol kinase family enzyme
VNSRRMLMKKRAPSNESVLALHDQDEFTIACIRPTALQVDGEGLGDVEEIRFTSHREALRVFI